MQSRLFLTFVTPDPPGQPPAPSLLAAHLDPEISTYELPWHALGDVPTRTVEGAAARLVSLIREIQPFGPYYIAGWSHGGVLAYEVAVQLVGADQEVAFLGLLDTSRVADDQYVAQPLPVPVHLFVAKDNIAAPPLRGWDAIVARSLLRAIGADGDHHTMMSAPHVKGLGATLSSAIRSAANTTTRLAGSLDSPVVPLQFGQPHVTPLYCVPGAGATVTGYARLVAAMGRRFPVYGLQPRGLGSELVPHSTVEAAARYYLRHLLPVHRRRPIHLLGHSAGGWVAFEMAQLLAEANQDVASLTILDSDPPGSIREFDPIDVLIEWIETCELILNRPLGIGRTDLIARTEQEWRTLLHQPLVAAGLLPARSTPDVLRGPLRTFASSLRTQYRPTKSYLRPLRLVLADDPRLDEDANRQRRDDLVNGWRAWSPDVLDVHAPGNHFTILQEPHVAALAQIVLEATSREELGHGVQA